MRAGETLDWAGEPLGELAERVRRALVGGEPVTVRLARHFPTSITEQAFAEEMQAVRLRLQADVRLVTTGFVAVFGGPGGT